MIAWEGLPILFTDEDSEVMRILIPKLTNHVSHRHRKWGVQQANLGLHMVLQPPEQYGVLRDEQMSFPVGRTKI